MKRSLLAIALLGCAAVAPAQPTVGAKRPSAANGQAVFMRMGCYTCHGTVGHGGAGPALAPGTLPLPAFQTWVRNGTPGWSVASGMPAFSRRLLPDAELADVREYLATRPAPRPTKDIALLNE
jgi:ubiquinol-cytochrome c reductase cytochrome c subunit